MEYHKPTVSTILMAICMIEGSNTAMKGVFFLDGLANPYSCFPDILNPSAPAYEADE